MKYNTPTIVLMTGLSLGARASSCLVITCLTNHVIKHAQMYSGCNSAYNITKTTLAKLSVVTVTGQHYVGSVVPSGTSCKIKLPLKNPVTSHLASPYNSLLRLLEHRPPTTSKGLPAARRMPQLATSTKLGTLAVELTWHELNACSGGLQLERNQPLDVTLLTDGQRDILRSHRPLLREALRQLRASLAAG